MMTDAAPDGVWDDGAARLRAQGEAGRLRVCRASEPNGAIWRVKDGRRLLDFSSNDYLNLSRHGEVIAGAREAAARYGAGAGASRLICGTLPVHEVLEAELAAFKGTEAALVFSSGYLANMGVIQALSRRADGSRVPVFADRMCHACIMDGMLQLGDGWRRFPHNDAGALEELLAGAGTGSGGGAEKNSGGWPTALAVTEGVFSMDGDAAPLRELADVCARHRAFLIIDDAHGTGVMGQGGRGSASAAGVDGLPHVIQTGTLSKALGSQGGFVCGPGGLRDLLINFSRTFIYDTALNPAAAAAALAALRVVRREPERVERLLKNAALLRLLSCPAQGAWAGSPCHILPAFPSQSGQAGCSSKNSAPAGIASLPARSREEASHPQPVTPIIPIIYGDENAALEASRILEEQGFLTTAIRPPTVPPGTSRLRLTVTAEHGEDQIRALGEAVDTVDRMDGMDK